MNRVVGRLSSFLFHRSPPPDRCRRHRRCARSSSSNSGGRGGSQGRCWGSEGDQGEGEEWELEQAVSVMNRKMQTSGMERLLRRERVQERHLKNSEKRVLARKNLERRIRSQEFHKKLRQALLNKLRGL